MSDKPISPLRQRMIDDMTARRFSEDTQRDYVRNVRNSRGLPWPVAGYGDERGSSPLSASYGAAADQPLVDQRRHRRAAVLFHPDARTARPRSPSEDRERAPQGAGRAEPGGSGAPAPSRARPQVQSGAQRRLRCGPTRLRSRAPEGVRHRQRSHDAQGRAGQGAAGSLCDALAATARTALSRRLRLAALSAAR